MICATMPKFALPSCRSGPSAGVDTSERGNSGLYHHLNRRDLTCSRRGLVSIKRLRRE